MKIVFVSTFILFLTGFAWASDRDKDTRLADSGMSELQGTWVGSEVGREGQVLMVFSGKLVFFQGAFPQEWYKGTGILDADQSPKHADFLIEDCGLVDFIGKQSKGIYKLDDDGILTFAGSMPGDDYRPSAFYPGNGVRVFRLKRETASVGEPGLAGVDVRKDELGAG